MVRLAYKIRSSNNQLVFDAFYKAVYLHPDAHPSFHSDRGFQYTSKTFYEKLRAANMRQSMSRVGRRIANGPMESFWGILKSEMYHLHRFENKAEPTAVIDIFLRYSGQNTM